MPRKYIPTGRPSGRPRKHALPDPAGAAAPTLAQSEDAPSLTTTAPPATDSPAGMAGGAGVGGHQVIWRPQAGPQQALLTCPIKDVFFGGARGGGKTDALCGDWLAHAGRHGKHARGILFRRSYDELDGVLNRMKELYLPLGAVWKSGSYVFHFPNGAELKLRYLDRDDDAANYQGHEYTWMAFDEVGNWPSPAPIDKLAATLRNAQGIPCVRRLTGNPGGPGHNWLFDRYVKGRQPFVPFQWKNEGGGVTTAVFIPSKLDDNPLLLQAQPDYEDTLKSTGNAALYQMWRFGRWDVVAGAAFDEFDPEVHVMDPFRPPPGWYIGAGMDFGVRNKSVLLLFATSPEGDVYAIDEFVWSQKPAYDSGKDAGVWLKKLGYNAGLVIGADGQMWANTGFGSATLASEFQQGLQDACGSGAPTIVSVSHGPGAISVRFNVIKKMLRFKRHADGTVKAWDMPKLRFTKNCPEIVRTLPTIPLSPKRVDAYDTRGDDHAIDALGYFLMSHQPKTAQVRESYGADRHPGFDPATMRRRQTGGMEMYSPDAAYQRLFRKSADGGFSMPFSMTLGHVPADDDFDF